MRIIANENISAGAIHSLRSTGYDVISVKETMRGATDMEILHRAQSEQCLIITNDKDFGELAFRMRLPSQCGVVLFRLSGKDPESDNQRIIEVLNSRNDWQGHFAVVDDLKIRIRPLPTSVVQIHKS
jgi:predicted nuclease of predicted toxin-antitoxin system